jgi:hypothetical protein
MPLLSFLKEWRLSRGVSKRIWTCLRWYPRRVGGRGFKAFTFKSDAFYDISSLIVGVFLFYVVVLNILWRQSTTFRFSIFMNMCFKLFLFYLCSTLIISS